MLPVATFRSTSADALAKRFELYPEMAYFGARRWAANARAVEFDSNSRIIVEGDEFIEITMDVET